MACQAGTLLALAPRDLALWRDRTRPIRSALCGFKVRLNPSVAATAALEHRRSPMTRKSFATILRCQFPWYESATGRLEIMNRARLWRFLTGDETYDTDYTGSPAWRNIMPERVAV